MKHQFSSSENEQSSTAHEQEQHVQTPGAKEFSSVEEMLRFDAAQTAVPERIGKRVQNSLSQVEPSKPWWRRWFGI